MPETPGLRGESFCVARTGDHPSAKVRAQIALKAVALMNSKGGRQIHEIQRWFAKELARIYLLNNPRIDRIVYGPEEKAELHHTRTPGSRDPVLLESTVLASRSQEVGRFKDFAIEVVRFVKATDPHLGASLTVNSIVRIAWDKELKG